MKQLNVDYKFGELVFCKASILKRALVGRIASFLQSILQHLTWHFESIADCVCQGTFFLTENNLFLSAYDNDNGRAVLVIVANHNQNSDLPMTHLSFFHH